MIEWINESLQDAAKDYFFLLNKDYPETPTLKLVGDRHRLTGLQRTVLFRGITSQDKTVSRKAKICADLRGKKLYVDGYNVLFTIMNYLLGKTIFIANDGLLRDSGGGYGKIEDETFFYKAADVLFDFIKKSGVQSIVIFLDSPMSNSTSHSNALETKMMEAGIVGKVILAKPADSELKKLSDGMIATSDSGIIDATGCQIFDLARNALAAHYRINARKIRETHEKKRIHGSQITRITRIIGYKEKK